MSPCEPTRATLLLRLRDARDAAAWGEFIEIYEPLLKGYCRKRGLQDADAADVSQEVLAAVAGSAVDFRYEPEKGAFRSWLLTVAFHKLGHFFERRKRHAPASGGTAAQRLLESQPSLDECRDWDQEYRRRLFDWAAERVRAELQPATWEAFRRTAIDNEDPAAVARDLGLSASAVYQARSRVTARLRERILEVEGSE